MNDVVVPETQTLRLVKENGDMILEDDVGSLDFLMADAQEGAVDALPGAYVADEC